MPLDLLRMKTSKISLLFLSCISASLCSSQTCEERVESCERKLKLQELNELPASCEEIDGQQGVSGSFLLNLDGSSVSVECLFDQGLTVMGGSKGTGDMAYSTVELMQMKSLIEQSDECHQNITFECVNVRTNVIC